MFNSEAAAALCALKGYYCAYAARERLIGVGRKVHIANTAEDGVASGARTELAGTPVDLRAVTESIVVARANYTELTIEVRGCC